MEAGETGGAGSLARYQSRALLSAHSRRRLAEIATERTWSKGAVMLRAGELPPFVLVVEQGQVRYSRIGRRGGEGLLSLPADAPLGLSSLVAQLPLRFTVSAAESCRTTLYDGREFLALMEADGRVAREFATMLARGVIWMQDAAQEAREEPLIARIHAELGRLKSTGQGRRVSDGYSLRLSQYDLACLLGSSREAVNPLLKQLERQGVLRLGYCNIVLLDGGFVEGETTCDESAFTRTFP